VKLGSGPRRGLAEAFTVATRTRSGFEAERDAPSRSNVCTKRPAATTSSSDSTSCVTIRLLPRVARPFRRRAAVRLQRIDRGDTRGAKCGSDAEEEVVAPWSPR
jgi:hypothetical protein